MKLFRVADGYTSTPFGHVPLMFVPPLDPFNSVPMADTASRTTFFPDANAIGYWSGLINAQQSEVDYSPSVQFEGPSNTPLQYVDIASMPQNAKSSAVEMRAAYYFYEKSKLSNQLKFNPNGPWLGRPASSWEKPNVVLPAGRVPSNAASTTSSNAALGVIGSQTNVWKMPIPAASYEARPTSQAPIARQPTQSSITSGRSGTLGFAPFATSNPFSFGTNPSTSAAANPLTLSQPSKAASKPMVVSQSSSIGQPTRVDAPATPLNLLYRDNLASPALSTRSASTITAGVVPSEWKDAEKAWEAARKILEAKEEALAQAKEEFRIAAEDEKAKFMAYRMMRENED